ncbi:polysaccharide biosynthesis protein [Pullulanibacillus sp. KACC 23026]|uniref:putative polysaccharide biosynthesis protein n=1 Tax=Pullulanibacillus sp. KACC 23026 TaxID=3028315 RepID=UPI0023B14C58|nr:polysaccharide biosynthesis protein [Pullulanibacillus sp. KACC 23026]WEG13851.1 polysaccharide biosynthesis protein [Pullulanibacillus sp. KACC 23026]
MSGSRMIRGTLILSAATFFTKFLGMLFVIPLYPIVGPDGGTLYGLAYTPYSIILSISTVGIPLAVSKFVAKYNALGDYYTGRRLFKSGLLLMTLTGIIGFLVMYGFAPVFALGAPKELVQPLTTVMRVTSFALILVPAMSLIRGYFQGFQSMGPTAVSQTVEQIVRVVFGLAGAYVIMATVKGTYHAKVSIAVSFVTFGAFMGALAGLIVLIRYWISRKSYIDKMVEESTTVQNIRLSSIYKEIIGYALPFVAVGLANQLYFLIDQGTVRHFLSLYFEMTKGQISDIISNLFTYDQKIILIPVSLATALGLSVVPSITESYAEGRQQDMQVKITQAFQFTIFITIPAAVGLSVLGYMVYGLLYGFENGLSAVISGGDLLQWYAPTAIFFAGFSVTAAILQGINHQKVTILSLCVGVLIKLILNPILLRLGVNGAILATDMGYLASILINLYAIGYSTRYRFTFIAKRLLLVCIFTLIMTVAVLIALSITGGFVPHTRLNALIRSIMGVVVGGGIYFLLSLKSGLLKQVLGSRFRRLERFM